MIRIGVFGGTFDPVHNGHIELVRNTARCIRSDKIMIVPTPLNPFKTDSEPIAGADDRLTMLRLAFKDDDYVEISDLEFAIGKPSCTYDTLKLISGIFSEAEIHFIVGSDSYMTLEDWQKSDSLLREMKFACAYRACDAETGDVSVKAAEYRKKYGTETVIIADKIQNVSSTSIREAVASGESIEGMVPRSIEHYIHEHRLYL